MAIMDGWRGIKERGLRSWWQVVRLPLLNTSALLHWAGTARHYLFAGITALPALFLKRWQPVRVFRFGDLGAHRLI